MTHRWSKKTDKGKPMLISITFYGSSGPINFVVYESFLITDVIHIALKKYRREGRLPVMGSNIGDYLLYCRNVGTDCSLDPWDTIGSTGVRNFTLFKKPRTSEAAGVHGKLSSNLKAWFTKSLHLKVSSH